MVQIGFVDGHIMGLILLLPLTYKLGLQSPKRPRNKRMKHSGGEKWVHGQNITNWDQTVITLKLEYLPLYNPSKNDWSGY